MQIHGRSYDAHAPVCLPSSHFGRVRRLFHVSTHSTRSELKHREFERCESKWLRPQHWNAIGTLFYAVASGALLYVIFESVALVQAEQKLSMFAVLYDPDVFDRPIVDDR